MLGRRNDHCDMPTVKTPLKASVSDLRVTKKLSAETRGALKLAKQFGDALVCVRHRTDDRGEYRYTTVELLVERSKISSRTDKIVKVRIGSDELQLQRVVRAAGGTWDFGARLWRIPRRVAGILKLTGRITEK